MTGKFAALVETLTACKDMQISVNIVSVSSLQVFFCSTICSAIRWSGFVLVNFFCTGKKV